MSQAIPYTRSTGFADDERDNVGGRAAVRTAQIDAELDSIAVPLNQTIANLARLQRDDGVMRDGVVPVTALGSDVLKLISVFGGTLRGAWVTATAYVAKDVVTQSGNTYICVVAHTSGVFATDLGTVKWILIQIGTNPNAASIPFSPTVNIASTNVQAAISEVDTNLRTIIAAAIQDKLGRFVSVRDYGAVGNGVVDDTTAIQNAINACLAAVISGNGGGCPRLLFPAGVYLTGTLSWTGRLHLQGDGSGSTFLQLKAGVTTSMFVVSAADVIGTSIDDASHNIITGMTLDGNRVDSTTTGSSHGIYCPDTSWSMATQYSASIIGEDLHIENFTGNGLHFGVNRNWCLLSKCVVRYCNDNGLALYGYDGRIEACDFGICKNVGVREFSGGANIFTGCNLYYSTFNYVANNFSNADSEFQGCNFDYAFQNGASVSSVSCAKKFIGCRFYGNSQTSAGLYSDILVTGAYLSTFVTISDCSFTFAVQKTKYLVETAGNPSIVFIGNHWARTGATVPYATGVSNTPAMLASNDDLFVNAMRFGVVGDGTTDDSAGIALAAAAVAGTGKKLYFPYATYGLAAGVSFDRCRVEGDNCLFKALTGIGSSPLVTLTGSTAVAPMIFGGVNLFGNGFGQDLLRVAGAAATCDFLKIERCILQNAVRDALSLTPSGTNCWIQNFRVSDVRILNPGRHGITMIAGNFSNTFVNQGIFDNIDVRGAGQTTAGYDVFCDSQGTLAAQKISEITWISCDLDAAGGASHAQGCISLNMTGTQSAYDGWTFLCVSPEDTGSVIVGTTKVIVINNSANVRGLTWKGGVVAKYGLIVDAALIGWGEVDCGTGARSFKKNDMTSPGFSTTYANDAAAAAASPPINIGQFYRNGSVVQIRVV